MRQVRPLPFQNVQWEPSSILSQSSSKRTALRFQIDDMIDVDGHPSPKADARDMASFLSLKVGMSVLKRQLRKRQEQQFQVPPVVIETTLMDTPLPVAPVDGLQGLEGTIAQVEAAQAKLKPTWKAAENAAEESIAALEHQQTSIPCASVDETTTSPRQDSSVTKEKGKPGVSLDSMLEQLQQEKRQAGLLEQETHSSRHKKEGDRVLTLEDGFSRYEDDDDESTSSPVELSPPKSGDDTIDVIPACVSTELGRTLEVLQKGLPPLRVPLKKAAVEPVVAKPIPATKESPTSLDGIVDKAVAIPTTPIPKLVVPLVVDVPVLSLEAKKSTEARQRALFSARLEQEQRRKNALEKEQHKLLHQKEGDRVVALEDAFSVDNEATPAEMPTASSRSTPNVVCTTSSEDLPSYVSNELGRRPLVVSQEGIPPLRVPLSAGTLGSAVRTTVVEQTNATKDEISDSPKDRESVQGALLEKRLKMEEKNQQVETNRIAEARHRALLKEHLKQDKQRQEEDAHVELSRSVATKQRVPEKAVQSESDNKSDEKALFKERMRVKEKRRQVEASRIAEAQQRALLAEHTNLDAKNRQQVAHAEASRSVGIKQRVPRDAVKEQANIRLDGSSSSFATEKVEATEPGFLSHLTEQLFTEQIMNEGVAIAKAMRAEEAQEITRTDELLIAQRTKEVNSIFSTKSKKGRQAKNTRLKPTKATTGMSNATALHPKVGTTSEQTTREMERPANNMKRQSSKQLIEKAEVTNPKSSDKVKHGNVGHLNPSMEERPAVATFLAGPQPKAPQQEKELTEFYASMSLADRAFSILKDLGMIQETPNPSDPDYDHSKDNEVCS